MMFVSFVIDLALVLYRIPMIFVSCVIQNTDDICLLCYRSYFCVIHLTDDVCFLC